MSGISLFLKYFPPKILAGPVVIILVLSMMVLPLPPLLLDLMFTFNIMVSIIVLLAAMRAQKPLDFISFPTVLLITTLLRLSLNVASTRAVLLDGHTGPAAAGKVIEAFGHFLIGGNYAVGFVVFMVLTIINFVVITKGAGRIAEVSARFALDSMPGKQMAIDADLNAGLIKEDEAKQRRQDVSRESEFYGSMDGASKFVRGDAIAGLIIMVINMIGGLIVGMIQHKMKLGDAASNYTLLAMGDGLVAQLPSLIISTAAGIMVSRVSSDEDIGVQMSKNLFSDPRNLYIASVIIGALGLVPGMPHIPFIGLALSLGWVARTLQKREERKVNEPIVAAPVTAPSDAEVTWGDISQVDVLSIEVGYRLIPMLDKTQDQDLLRRVRNIRKKFAQEKGFLPPVVHVHDDIEIGPGDYRISVKGVEVGRGQIHPEKMLAISPAEDASPIPGEKTIEPTFGMAAVWISKNDVDFAQLCNYTIVDPGTVLSTHLGHLLRRHASELLGREEVQEMVDHLKTVAPKLVEDTVPKIFPLALLQRVLQQLLSEGVSVRDLRTILETMTEHFGKTQEPVDLATQVRIALSRSIVQDLVGSQPIISVIAFDPSLEDLLSNAYGSGSGAIDPGIADRMMKETAETSRMVEEMGGTPILVVSAPLRTSLSRFLRRAAPNLTVLSHEEIPDGRRLEIANIIGAR